MIDWLRKDRRDPMPDPRIEIAGRSLPIALRRHKCAKRLTMRLSPDGSELRITLPTWGRSLDALAFAQDRAQWIERQLARVPDQVAIENGSLISLHGQPLLIAWQADSARKPLLHGDRLVLGGPQERIETRVQRWLEQHAMDVFASDLAFYCQRAGQAAPRLRLSRARRRWGSCTGPRHGGNNRHETCIRINWRLIMAADNVRRSVVAHEVAHLAHFDHSPAFHAHLAELFDGDMPAADDWLKVHGRSLYASFA